LRLAILVLDIQTGRVSKISEGLSVSWAPSGEWIALISPVDNNRFQVRLMHSDGTGSRVVRTFHSDVVPYSKPVWSPDSKTLLLNESQDPDKDTWNVYLLDLATLKTTRKFRGVPPVFAWIAAK
jgi:Tol biopolymer transport system component